MTKLEMNDIQETPNSLSELETQQKVMECGDFIPEDVDTDSLKKVVEFEWNITKEFMRMVEKAADNQFG